ncbi:hypothetical protein [Microbispora sp. H10949]|uniref:hypothetical protein n=1 Tax=Microbispora sp. H10949 TaxID=2729111 RepID=UPI001601C142|nr:hypothetical protein [Microbispora sp. H10949]
MTWNAKKGLVSRSFAEWQAVDRDIRTYLSLTARWSERGYQELWNQAESELSAIFDPDVHHGDEHVGFFSDKVNDLWPNDYEWMLHASVVRDAVSAFEVYLEKGMDEALHAIGLDLRRKANRPSPEWKTMVVIHKALGSDVETDRVKHIRALRHMLVHQRGELRTEKMRDRFAEGPRAYPLVHRETGEPLTLEADFVGDQVQLELATVEAVLDDLAAVVRETDTRVWHIAWNADRAELEAISRTLKPDAD